MKSIFPSNPKDGFDSLFESFKDNILSIDPVYFCEKYLTIDGKSFQLNGSGYKPFADIYRYIALKAIEPDAKPVVMVKGRQVGATTMAAALECYFMACGLFGNNQRPPMKILHLFPTLGLAAAYTKDKLDSIIGGAKSVPGELKSNGLLKSYIETKFDSSSPANNNMHFKKFINGNQIWIESTGIDGDRIRGRTGEAAFFDECFPYDQKIETMNGKIKIGRLCDLYTYGKELPYVKSYNEIKNIFEFKRVKRAWQKGIKKLVKIITNNYEVKCTENHRFLTVDGWKEAKNLLKDDLIKASPYVFECDYLPTSNSIPVESVISVEKLKGEEVVYDIEVEDNHNFIVTSEDERSFGGLIAHNCQDIPDMALGAVTKVLAQAKYGKRGEGVQIYFGTPKTKGGSYYKMWENSSQNYYNLRCEKCSEYFPLYGPDINWEDVWVYGQTVCCPKCKCEQDKNEAVERGKWIPINNPDKVDFIGYHFNQLYIPHFTKETILRAKPDRNPINTERTYMNEVLGEFYDGDGGTISVEEIHQNCADKGRKMAKVISPAQNIRVYAGFDWGQRGTLDQAVGRRQGKSYSCAVVITADGPNIFNVEFATRLMRNDPQSKVDIVEEMFRRYSVTQSVGDIGDAFDLTHKLQHIYGDKFLASRSSHRVMGHIKFSEDEFPKVIMFEKDYYISELIGLLKEGKIKFPYGSYDRIDWLVKHCSSMDTKITRDRSGEPIKRYVKGDGPNDGMMALLNAYLAWKYDVTQGFKIKSPQHMRYEITNHAKPFDAVIGYVPRL